MGKQRMRKIRLTFWLVTVVFGLVGGPTTAAGRVIYVDWDAAGNNDGSSWADAYKYLQDSLADADSGAKPVEILVAQGIYTPDSNSADPNGSGERKATFQLVNGVAIRGGYGGIIETEPNARDIELYETVLSGDIGTVPDSSDNSYHVVTGSGTGANTILDGVTITGGNANSSGLHNDGGGMLNENGRPTLTKCTFSRNSARVYGGGVYNDSNSDPTLVNCIFQDNYANQRGGGMYNRQDSSPTLTNCSFIGNSVMAGGEACGGGGMYNEESHPILTNCVFQDNDGAEGGGIWNDNSDPTLTNCNFIRNAGTYYGGGISNASGSEPVLFDCIFSENASRIGGGVYNYGSSVELTKCTLIDNSSGWHGGAMYSYSSSLDLSNCVFISNQAGLQGGGIHCCRSSNLTVTNCTFVANSASAGNALACRSYLGRYPSNVEMTGCILWDGGNEIWNEDSSHIDVTYSDVAGGCAGDGNIDADPYFADVNNGDYHLKSQAGRWEPNSQTWVQDVVTSPCIDAGDMNSPIGLEPFPNGGRINMGAYGGTAEASKSYFGQPVCEIIVAGDINGDCKVNFKDFAIMAHHWLEDNNP